MILIWLGGNNWAFAGVAAITSEASTRQIASRNSLILADQSFVFPPSSHSRDQAAADADTGNSTMASPAATCGIATCWSTKTTK